MVRSGLRWLAKLSKVSEHLVPLNHPRLHTHTRQRHVQHGSFASLQSCRWAGEGSHHQACDSNALLSTTVMGAHRSSTGRGDPAPRRRRTLGVGAASSSLRCQQPLRCACRGRTCRRNLLRRTPSRGGGGGLEGRERERESARSSKQTQEQEPIFARGQGRETRLLANIIYIFLH